MSQKPDLLQLQKRLYQQIHVGNQKMPQNADSVQSQLTELARLCVGRVVLICLDDMVRFLFLDLGTYSLTTLLCCHQWDSSHEQCFACIDTKTASRLLVTTRIKGMLQDATEVELELLGLQESVELLSGVAELDDGQSPPALLEIAQLCGRLPLCLSIVGKLIKTFGGGWEVNIAALIVSIVLLIVCVGGSAGDTEE
jgi:hypothetical protein